MEPPPPRFSAVHKIIRRVWARGLSQQRGAGDPTDGCSAGTDLAARYRSLPLPVCAPLSRGLGGRQCLLGLILLGCSIQLQSRTHCPLSLRPPNFSLELAFVLVWGGQCVREISSPAPGAEPFTVLQSPWLAFRDGHAFWLG